MNAETGRYTAPAESTIAAGWKLERLTPPSRLSGANGIRTGKDGRIYVAQVAGNKVSAVNPDTGAIETISPAGGGIVGPDDLVFDDEGNLYCTEITEGRVSMMRPDGSYKVIEGNLPVANPITFHQGHLIAGELRMGGRIVELDRDGGAPRVICEGVPMANAFDVGPDGKLYFPAQGANEIWRVGLDGGAPEVVVKDLGVPDSVKFHPDGYIVSTQVYSGQVLKIDPRTGEKTVLADIGPGLDNVAFVGSRIFVSHITGSIHEITATGVVRPLVDKGLQWPLGIAAADDGTVFVADGGFTYSLSPGGSLELIGTLFSQGFPGWVRDVAACGGGEWIVSTANGDVARWNPAAQESKMLASGYDRLMGVALGKDGAVAFAETGTGRVILVDNGETTELANGLSGPMGVAIADNGTVYVAECEAGRVVRLSGGSSETVIDGLERPEGIAIAAGKLFIVDTLAKTVISCDLSGGGRQTLADNLPVGAPVGIIGRHAGGVGDMCGPMWSFTGISAGSDGALYIAGDAEGSVLALRRS